MTRLFKFGSKRMAAEETSDSDFQEIVDNGSPPAADPHHKKSLGHGRKFSLRRAFSRSSASPGPAEVGRSRSIGEAMRNRLSKFSDGLIIPLEEAYVTELLRDEPLVVFTKSTCPFSAKLAELLKRVHLTPCVVKVDERGTQQYKYINILINFVQRIRSSCLNIWQQERSTRWCRTCSWRRSLSVDTMIWPSWLRESKTGWSG